MKLKLSQVINANEPLRRLAGEKYAPNIAFRIQKIIRAMEPEVAAYNKARNDLIQNQYGEPVENDAGIPNGYRVKPDQLESFGAALSALLDEEIEIEFVKIPLEYLHEITALDMGALAWMVECPDDQPSTPALGKKRKRA